MEKRLYYVRKWLNLPRHESFGSIIAEVTVRSYKTKDRKTQKDVTDWELTGDFSLADCSRNVTLNLSTFARAGQARTAEIRNIRHKAHMLRAIVNDYCDAIEKGCDYLEGKVE